MQRICKLLRRNGMLGYRRESDYTCVEHFRPFDDQTCDIFQPNISVEKPVYCVTDGN